jgi:hypothetical protein
LQSKIAYAKIAYANFAYLNFYVNTASRRGTCISQCDIRDLPVFHRTALARDELLTITKVDGVGTTVSAFLGQLCMMERWHRKEAVSAPAKWRVQAIKEVSMPRQPNPLTAVEPDVYLSRRRIFETDDGLKRLVGSNVLCTGAVVSYLSVWACTSPVIIFGLSDVIY